MAEAAAGLVIAFEVISTAVEGGAVGAYALSRPTLPLKASFSCVATTPKVDSPYQIIFRDSLARYSHTINIVNGDLYIFGGQVSHDALASNEMHILKLSNVGGLGPQYKAVPAVARDGDDIPAPRAGHTTCVINEKIIMFGGYGDASDPSQPLDERGRVWIFHPESLHWSHLDVSNGDTLNRSCHAAAICGPKLIVHGGYSTRGDKPRTDTWAFDLSARMWVQLASLQSVADAASMLVTAPPNCGLINEKLYVVTATSTSGSQVHTLDLCDYDQSKLEKQIPITERQWTTIEYRTNPKMSSPEPRKGARLIPVSTGMGRSYLIFMLGAKESFNNTDDQAAFWSNSWALQLPSGSTSLAQAKDAARDKLGLDSHEAEWAEIEIVVDQENEDDAPSKGLGKSHPGPRSDFACTTFEGSSTIFLWGGRDPTGETQGDGWTVQLKAK